MLPRRAACASTGSARRSAATQPALEAELAALDAERSTRSATRSRPRASSSSCAAIRRAPRRASTRSPTARSSRRSCSSRETPRPGTALTHRRRGRLQRAGAGRGAGRPARARGARQSRSSTRGSRRWSATRRPSAAAPSSSTRTTRCSSRATTSGSTPLGLSNLDALYLCASAAPGRPVRPRAAARARAPRAARPRASRPRRACGSHYERAAAALLPTELSLGEFLELNAAFRAARSSARARSTRRDFVTRRRPRRLRGRRRRAASRADRAVASLTAGARRADAAEVAAADAAGRTLRERLVDLVFLGIPEAVPLLRARRRTSERSRLLGQARTIEAGGDPPARAVAGARGRASTLQARRPTQRVRHEQERLEAVFGRGFRALPLVRPANAARSSERRSPARTRCSAATRSQALSWLQGVSRVRPGASRLSGALCYAAALAPHRRARAQGRPAAVRRRRALGRAACRRRPATRPASSRSSRTSRRAFKPAQPLAGLVLDEWVETVPAAEVTTGVSFNYDAPGARPPQAVLLAVAPPGAERWDVETLEQILLETLELAQLRAVDPQALGGDALLQRALPALYVSGNVAGEALSTDFARAVSCTCRRSRSGRGSSPSRGSTTSTRACRRGRTTRSGCSRASGRPASSRARTRARRCRRACGWSARRSRASAPARRERIGAVPHRRPARDARRARARAARRRPAPRPARGGRGRALLPAAARALRRLRPGPPGVSSRAEDSAARPPRRRRRSRRRRYLAVMARPRAGRLPRLPEARADASTGRRRSEAAGQAAILPRPTRRRRSRPRVAFLDWFDARYGLAPAARRRAVGDADVGLRAARVLVRRLGAGPPTARSLSPRPSIPAARSSGTRSTSTRPRHSAPGPADPQPESVVRTVIPAPVRYSGMAADRWWEFEDGRVNLNRIEGDPDELMRLLLVEFALAYSNDWFVMPGRRRAGRALPPAVARGHRRLRRAHPRAALHGLGACRTPSGGCSRSARPRLARRAERSPGSALPAAGARGERPRRPGRGGDLPPRRAVEPRLGGRAARAEHRRRAPSTAPSCYEQPRTPTRCRCRRRSATGDARYRLATDRARLLDPVPAAAHRPGEAGHPPAARPPR